MHDNYVSFFIRDKEKWIVGELKQSDISWANASLDCFFLIISHRVSN